MIIHDQFDKEIRLNFTQPQDKPNGEHVLAIAFLNDSYLLTRHKKRGIEFPGGKIEQGESSEAAIVREVYEETGGIVAEMTYVAQYTVYHPEGTKWFTKDVFAVQVDTLESKNDYLETAGPVTCKHLDEISDEEKSFLLEDEAILKCVERVIELGLYQKKEDAD
ncbi:RNA deprotection pyrophosphohydrolase [Staphylococcus simulans]|uniref:RNA deprotection pyrophosphohydrolase n=1 Tax=Staphylococcus simulans TaxID=1286 RepID=UPI000D03DC27|nr:nucleoside triphosphatase YtkD [Staphylococcus simulans]PTJ50995.1 nucleoside triphosphatase YtkD [Staphylococcus simulans]